MEIYDSLSRENKKIAKGKKLKLFVCGPTVYDDAHIGHARTYLVFDAFVRYLRGRGFKVFYLQNITDVDDKTIDRARREKKNPLSIARLFEKRYREDMEKIGIASVDRYARATDFIPEITAQVEALIKKGYAYRATDGYYFDIKKFKDYGKLSGRTALQAEDAVSRIDESVDKRNKGDFALWKFSQPGEPAWDTKFGKGRPGWHIEDTAISEKFFGPQYDFHGGANELKFPHHEAEIAQQEAASGKKPFVKVWMHTGVLTIGGKKMSKSLKNFITIRKFLETHPAETLRLAVFKHHYRKPVDYGEELINQAETERKYFSELLKKLELVEKQSKSKSGGGKIKEFIAEGVKNFSEALDNDFNTPQALAAIQKLATRLEKKMWLISRSEAKSTRIALEKLFKLVGLSFKDGGIPPRINDILKRRELFRANKQFSKADALRKRIWVLGYEVEDTPLGPLVLPKNYDQRQNKSSAARPGS